MKLQYLDQSSVSETIIFASNVDGFGMSTVGPPLTERQHRVLDFIAQYAKDHGFPPTYQELRLHMGYSSLNAVSEVLRALERKGYIRRLPGRSRSIILTNTPNQESPLTVSQKTDTIPIIGTANGDNLLSALLRPRGLVSVDSSFFELSGVEFFAALAESDDLYDEGIRRGDLLLIVPTEEPPNGSLVLCFTQEGQQILRRYSRRADGTIELRAARRGAITMQFQPDDQSLRIVGIVRGLLRRF